MSFEKVDSEEVYSGVIASVRVEHFRHDDGEVVRREVIGHPGAVAVVAHDGEHLWLVRQPREAAGEESLLEIPAGKLDVEGEPPLETAKRELAEEIGKAAATWQDLGWVWMSPGFTDEVMWLYLATDLTDVPRPEVDEDERIEILAWPLEDLDGAIDECRDAKSLCGLLEFARLRSRGG